MRFAASQFPRIVVDSSLIGAPGALKTNPLLRHNDYEEEMEYISKYIKETTMA